MERSEKDSIEKMIEHGNMPYHDVPELGIEGRRDNELRIKQLKLPSLVGKDVVDIGCNSGFFCKWAIQNEALSTTGIDLSETVEAAKQVNGNIGSLWYGVNLKCVGTDQVRILIEESGSCDVMFFFSMFKLLGIPHFLSLADHVIIENNNDKFEDYIQWRLGRIGFKKVEHCGYTTDFGKRSIIKGWK